MKKNLIAATVVAFSLQACGQKAVPEAVLSAFQNKFKAASHIKWEQEEPTEWEAGFLVDKKEYTASFNEKGAWLETELELETEELPSFVKEAIKNNLGNIRIIEACQIQTPDYTGYELLVKSDGEKQEILIDENGKMTRKNESEKEEKEEGEEK